MVTVKRANVILTIEDDEVEKYFEKGYSVLDKYGNVVKASVPTELGTLQKAYQDQEVIIAKQQRQIEALKEENKNLLAMLNNPVPKQEEIKEPRRAGRKKVSE